MFVPVAVLGAAVWIGFLAFTNVRERTMEIGILRALGLKSRQVLVLFLSRALAIGFAGAILGFAGGVLATWPAVPAAQLPWLPVVLLASPLLAALASWLPALMATQQDPADILNKE